MARKTGPQEAAEVSIRVALSSATGRQGTHHACLNGRQRALLGVIMQGWLDLCGSTERATCINTATLGSCSSFGACMGQAGG